MLKIENIESWRIEILQIIILIDFLLNTYIIITKCFIMQ